MRQRARILAAPVLGRPDLAASGQLGIGPPARRRGAACDAAPVGDRAADLRGGHAAGSDGHQAREQPRARLRDDRDGRRLFAVRNYGVDPQVLYDVMTEGLFSSPAYKGYGKTMVDQT